jgi:hypothetical protein
VQIERRSIAGILTASRLHLRLSGPPVLPEADREAIPEVQGPRAF